MNTNKIVFFTGLLLMMPTPSGADEPSLLPARDITLGEVAVGAAVGLIFPISNNGDSPVQIISISMAAASPGEVAVATREPVRALLPGEDLMLIAQWRPASEGVLTDAFVTVETDQGTLGIPIAGHTPGHGPAGAGASFTPVLDISNLTIISAEAVSSTVTTAGGTSRSAEHVIEISRVRGAGGADESSLRAELEAALPYFNACLGGAPMGTGAIKLRATVYEDGSLRDVSVFRDRLDNGAFTECIVEAVEAQVRVAPPVPEQSAVTFAVQHRVQ